VFHALIGLVERFGGHVIFSGDAITCWLDGDDGGAPPLALECKERWGRC
jgi:hypothetical protein